MSHPPSEPALKPAPPAAPLKRRGLLLGTGVVAVTGIAAAVAARGLQPSIPEPAVAKAKADDAADGYRLSPHVLRYYETTRV